MISITIIEENKPFKNREGVIRYHCLRAFHSSQLKHAGVNQDYIDLLQGHKLSATKRAYMHKAVRQEFIKAEERLSVRRVSANHDSIEQMRQTIIAQQKQVGDYQLRAKILEDELKQVEGRLAERDSEIADLERQLGEANEKTNLRFARIEKILKIGEES